MSWSEFYWYLILSFWNIWTNTWCASSVWVSISFIFSIEPKEENSRNCSTKKKNYTNNETNGWSSWNFWIQLIGFFTSFLIWVLTSFNRKKSSNKKNQSDNCWNKTQSWFWIHDIIELKKLYFYFYTNTKK